MYNVSSLSIIRYCQKLPGDQYTVMAPDFKLKEVNDEICELDSKLYETLFLCTVYLPTCSPVRSEQVKKEKEIIVHVTFNVFIQNITHSTPIFF